MIALQFSQPFRTWIDLLQFLQGVTQEIDQFAAVAAVALEFVDAAADVAPMLRGGAHARQLFPVLAVLIDQIELVGARQQGLMLVLSVDLDQESGQFAQLLQGGSAAVDESA